MPDPKTKPLFFRKLCIKAGLCPVGKVCPEGTGVPKDCPAGHYCGAEGLDTPLGQCDKGFYCAPGKLLKFIYINLFLCTMICSRQVFRIYIYYFVFAYNDDFLFKKIPAFLAWRY